MSVFVNYSCLLHTKPHDRSNQSMLNNTVSSIVALLDTLSFWPSKMGTFCKGTQEHRLQQLSHRRGHVAVSVSHEFMFKKIKRLITKV